GGADGRSKGVDETSRGAIPQYPPALHLPHRPDQPCQQEEVRGQRVVLGQPIREAAVAEHVLPQREARGERRRVHGGGPHLPTGEGAPGEEQAEEEMGDPPPRRQEIDLAREEERNVQYSPEEPVDPKVGRPPPPNDAQEHRGGSRREHEQGEEPRYFVPAP